MAKKIKLTVYIVLFIASFSLSAAPEKNSTNALFFQYSFDNELRQIDSIGMYLRSSQFDDSTIGSSYGTTLELPIGYTNDKISFKYSGFGGATMKYKPRGIDALLTIGPNLSVSMLSDTYYRYMMFDVGIILDLATTYPVSENVAVVMGTSMIFDAGRYYYFRTASTTSSGFEEEFFQLNVKMYLGFSVRK